MAKSYEQYLVEFTAGPDGDVQTGYWIALGAASARAAITRFRKKHPQLENLHVEGSWTRFVVDEGSED